MDNIKNLIKYELDRQLRYKFKNNKKVATFQKIVDHAITCVERCIDERISREIPTWLIEKYKHKKDSAVLSSESIWNDRIRDMNLKYQESSRDAYELVDMLEYHKYLREEIERLKDPVKNRVARTKREAVERDLVNFESLIADQLENSMISQDVKDTIIKSNFVVEDKDIKLYLKQ